MKRYFINEKEFPEDIAEATEALNNEILNDALKDGDVSQLVNISFVVCVEA